MKVAFFNNGNTMAVREDGEQIPEFQVSWFGLYIKFLKENDIDCEFTTFIMPDGQKAEYDETYNNWTIV